MKNLDSPNGDDDSSNREEAEAKGTSTSTKPDSVLIHLNELRDLRAVAEGNDIIDHPAVSWIPRFDQDIARIYGGNPTAEKTDENMTYMWIQDPALVKEHQEWCPRAYDLMLEKDLITQLIERAENRHKANDTAWDQPRLEAEGTEKVAESESEREAHKISKALQKSPANADGDGGVHMPTRKSEVDMDLDMHTDANINAGENHPYSPDLPMGPAVSMVQKAAELGHREVSSLNEVNMDLGTSTNASESHSSSPNLPVDSALEMAPKATEPGHSEVAPVPQTKTTHPPFKPKRGYKSVAHLRDSSWLFDD